MPMIFTKIIHTKIHIDITNENDVNKTIMVTYEELIYIPILMDTFYI